MCWLLHFFAIFVFLLLCKSLLLVSKPSYCSPSEHISFRASLPIFFFYYQNPQFRLPTYTTSTPSSYLKFSASSKTRAILLSSRSLPSKFKFKFQGFTFSLFSIPQRQKVFSFSFSISL